MNYSSQKHNPTELVQMVRREMDGRKEIEAQNSINTTTLSLMQLCNYIATMQLYCNNVVTAASATLVAATIMLLLQFSLI
jgi:hypothetical protein